MAFHQLLYCINLFIISYHIYIYHVLYYINASYCDYINTPYLSISFVLEQKQSRHLARLSGKKKERGSHCQGVAVSQQMQQHRIEGKQ